MKAILLATAAGLCWGIGELFTKSVLHTHKVGPVTAIAVRSTVALPVLWLAYYIAVHVSRAEPADWRTAGTPTLLKLTLGSGLIAGAAAMICFYAALNVGEISRVKPIAFALAPAVASLLAIVVLHEPFTARKAFGIAAILLGVLLLTGK
ncbi:MAG: DMT family transporter [Planctomycetota bacterium]|nr:MAG: DMT family transporter [Planctomycetota bacterium]